MCSDKATHISLQCVRVDFDKIRVFLFVSLLLLLNHVNAI